MDNTHELVQYKTVIKFGSVITPKTYECLVKAVMLVDTSDGTVSSILSFTGVIAPETIRSIPYKILTEEAVFQAARAKSIAFIQMEDLMPSEDLVGSPLPEVLTELAAGVIYHIEKHSRLIKVHTYETLWTNNH